MAWFTHYRIVSERSDFHSGMGVLFTQHRGNPIRSAERKYDGILENTGTGTRTCGHAHTDTYGKDGQLLFRNYHNINVHRSLYDARNAAQ